MCHAEPTNSFRNISALIKQLKHVLLRVESDLRRVWELCKGFYVEDAIDAFCIKTVPRPLTDGDNVE